MTEQCHELMLAYQRELRQIQETIASAKRRSKRLQKAIRALHQLEYIPEKRINPPLNGSKYQPMFAD